MATNEVYSRPEVGADTCLRVACTHCGAKPGSTCVNKVDLPVGAPREDPHQARLDAYATHGAPSSERLGPGVPKVGDKFRVKDTYHGCCPYVKPGDVVTFKVDNFSGRRCICPNGEDWGFEITSLEAPAEPVPAAPPVGREPQVGDYESWRNGGGPCRACGCTFKAWSSDNGGATAIAHCAAHDCHCSRVAAGKEPESCCRRAAARLHAPTTPTGVPAKLCDKLIGGAGGDLLCNRPAGHDGVTACGWSYERGPQKRLRDIEPAPSKPTKAVRERVTVKALWNGDGTFTVMGKPRPTYESLMREAREADGLPGEDPRCRRCKVPAPLNHFGDCQVCHGEDDHGTAARMVDRGHVTPATPNPEPWVPSCDVDQDILNEWEW